MSCLETSFEKISVGISSCALVFAAICLIYVVHHDYEINPDEEENVRSCSLVGPSLASAVVECLEGKTGVCCEEYCKGLSQVLNRTLSVMELRGSPVVPLEYTSPSAHIAYNVGDNAKEPDFSNEDYIHHYINTSTNPCESNPYGVELQQGGLRINYTGTYYVYSSITFHPRSSKTPSEFQFQTWLHYVLRHRHNSPANSGIIMRTVHTLCPTCKGNMETAFIGGVFNLSANDEIQVAMSGSHLFDWHRHSTYLGLFFLA
ncbi:tumor necrosis factor ligand superfamily member 6-like [Physella acuta]|uniref:tumor necrosis factor ligand superfamily member 6-like n=1 Tax=Physella acuta TaxID=109671 RepID=UPI0027DB596C|nr:tumor necrosis factor ligand superfamily member 6-like [Physella acuta]